MVWSGDTSTCWSFATAVVVACPLTTAQEPSPTTDLRLQELERTNRLLERRLSELETRSGRETAVTEGAEGGAIDVGAARTTMQVFADMGFRANDRRDPNAANSSASFGSLDLFLIADLGDGIEALTETVLEGDADANEVVVDQERLWLKWRDSDLLYLKVGLEHSALVHWNREFHHGKWLFHGTDRPFLGRFEDDTGIMPSHGVGLEIGGAWLSELGSIHYSFAITNGRGVDPTDRQLVADANDAKALELALACHRGGLQFGGAARTDLIPSDPGDPARTVSIREHAASAFLDWQNGPLDVRVEGAAILHDLRGGGQFTHHTGFAQVAWSLGSLTPFVRLDTRVMAVGDPFYGAVDADLDATECVLGARWDFHERATLKFDVTWGRGEERSGALVERDDYTVFAMEVAWVL